MTTTFKVEKVHCQACAKKITNAIQGVQPGASVSVDITQGLVSVDAGDRAAVLKAIEDAGYPAKIAA